MKLSNVLESGITGAATVSLLRESLQGAGSKVNNTGLFQKKGIIKRFKKAGQKKGLKSVKSYVQLATDLLGFAGYMGLTALGKKKNAVLRGGVLGGLAGAVAILSNLKQEDPEANNMEIWRERLVTVALYILAGVVAGGAIDMFTKSKKKK